MILTESLLYILSSHTDSLVYILSPQTDSLVYILSSQTDSLVYILSSQTIFKPRDALMSRANSLKKAIRQIIEHTERGKYEFC